MFHEITLDNLEDIKEVQSIFSDVFVQKNELINTFNANPYVHLYTYSVDKKIVAFIQYDEIYDRFELINIFVVEEYRNKKIASLLIEYMIKDAEHKKVRNITLEVRADNIVAINLYHKYGFHNVAIREKYYNNCDGILMEKEMM